MDAFDADVVIYASKGDPRGDLLAKAIDSHPGDRVGVGSVLLLTETLNLGSGDLHGTRLREVLAALQLVPVDSQIALVASALRGTYRLKTPDALHLATAIVSSADRFVTGNRKDFGARIREIDVVHP